MNSDELATLGLCEIYKIIGHPEGRLIIKELIKGDKHPKDLEFLNINGARMYYLLKMMVFTQIVDKKVNNDRTTIYSLSAFGRNVLKLSEPLVDEISRVFAGRKSLLLDKKSLFLDAMKEWKINK